MEEEIQEKITEVVVNNEPINNEPLASVTNTQDKSGKYFNKFDKKKNFKKDGKRFEERRPREDVEKVVVCTNRVSKSVKGGKILNFSALVVVGDRNGKVGVGSGKSRETTDAVERAFKSAKKHMITVPMVGTTIPHAIEAKFETSKVILRPSVEGNGIIAGGAARAVLELAGIKDITAKIHGSSNKANCVKATIEALKNLKTKEEVANQRGVDLNGD